MMRLRWVVLVNLVVPGAGLIVLRREWLGFALSLLFCVLAEIGLVGWLLVPATMPGWVSGLALAGGGGVWGWSQWLLLRRIRTSCGEAAERELQVLGRRVDEAVAANNLSEARDLLRAALTINDEHVATNVRWAELMMLMDRCGEASNAWRRVLQLDGDAEGRRKAAAALGALSGG